MISSIIDSPQGYVGVFIEGYDFKAIPAICLALKDGHLVPLFSAEGEIVPGPEIDSFRGYFDSETAEEMEQELEEERQEEENEEAIKEAAKKGEST